MMENKKKKTIAITAASVVIVLAATFVALGLTVWRPKSTDEWLRDFAASLTMPQGQEEQKYEKTITIEQDGQKASTFFQTVEIHIQDGRPVGHILVEEKYYGLGTTEFDVNDEYYFYDGKMYMRRSNGDDISNTEFTSNWDVFWEVACENWGNNGYVLKKTVFEKMKISHSKGIHKLTATVSSDNRKEFLGGAEDFKDISQAELAMSVNDGLQLVDFTLSYRYKDNQSVIINIVGKEPTQIEIKDFYN